MNTDQFLDGTTFGMEFDCGEWDRKLPVPDGIVFCTDEVAGHTAKGVGADPTITYNLFGGEAITKPCASEKELHDLITAALRDNLAQDLHYPGTIHVHVRVPRLLQRVDLIKKLVLWNQVWWPKFAPYLYKSENGPRSKYDEWLYNCNWEVKNLTYPRASIDRMERADTAESVALLLHDNPKDWKNEWHRKTDQVKRPAVNFGHLALNETIEFRCFTTTTNPATLWNIITFPLNYLRMALANDSDPLKIVRGVRFQDKPYELPDLGDIPDKTSGYFNDTKRGILIALINKQITIADLNYPQYWIDKGFQ